MIATKDWLKASWDAGKDMLTPLSGRSSGEAHAPTPVMVPIRALGPSYRERITQVTGKIDVPVIAMAHLAFAENADHKQCAEFGVSVLKKARGRGFGARLFERAVMHARNEGVNMVFIHALTENTAMLKIARNAGATVQRDGSESEAYLQISPPSLDTRMAEIVEQQYAELDYRLKRQAKQFWDFLAGVQEVRQGVRKARHQSAE